MFNILMGAFVKKLVFMCVRACVRVCVCVRERWKFTQSFANTVDNVRNILRQYLFVCTVYVLFFFVKSEVMNHHIILHIVCF
jgi:hypothetical protein